MEEKRYTCKGCGNEIDPDCCWCGSDCRSDWGSCRGFVPMGCDKEHTVALKRYGRSCHGFVPMGCDCVRNAAKKQVETWDSLKDGT